MQEFIAAQANGSQANAGAYCEGMEENHHKLVDGKKILSKNNLFLRICSWNLENPEYLGSGDDLQPQKPRLHYCSPGLDLAACEKISQKAMANPEIRCPQVGHF